MRKENVPRTAADMFPSEEDWVALQGGEPQVYYKPKDPRKAWRVVHVYSEGTDFTDGRILPTIPPEGNWVGFADINLDNGKVGGSTRTIRVPRMMVNDLHGNPCENRSGNHASSAYDRIKYEDEHNEFLREIARAGFWELKYTLVGEKPMFIPHRINVELYSSNW